MFFAVTSSTRLSIMKTLPVFQIFYKGWSVRIHTVKCATSRTPIKYNSRARRWSNLFVLSRSTTILMIRIVYVADSDFFLPEGVSGTRTIQLSNDLRNNSISATPRATKLLLISRVYCILIYDKLSLRTQKKFLCNDNWQERHCLKISNVQYPLNKSYCCIRSDVSTTYIPKKMAFHLI